MSTFFFKTAALSTALLISTAGVTAFAAQVSVGGVTAGVGGNGVSVGTGGGVSGSATVGGGGGNVASGHVGAGGHAADVSIGLGGGPLAKVDSNGNPVKSKSSAAINLGSLLNGLDLSGIPGGGGGAGGGGLGGSAGGGGGVAHSARVIAAGLSADDQAVLKVRCRDVVARPGGFSRNVVQFCRLIAKL